jgi:hypothetical protein
MASFRDFLGRPAGRTVRVIAGVAIIALGLGVLRGRASAAVAALGLLSLSSGARGVCPIDWAFPGKIGRCG